MKLNLSTVAVAVVAALILLAGCSGVSESDLVGDWTSRTEPEQGEESSPAVEVVLDVMAPRLELNEDRTFTMSIGLPIKGTWELKDGQLLLTTDTVAGMDAKVVRGTDEPIVLDVSDDGKELTGTVTSGSLSGSVMFGKTEK